MIKRILFLLLASISLPLAVTAEIKPALTENDLENIKANAILEGALMTSCLAVVNDFMSINEHKDLMRYNLIQHEEKFTNSDQAEREKRWLVFHTVASNKPRYSQQMTEGEFVHAMGIIAPNLERFHLRNLFHEIDTDGNGVIDIDEFLSGIDDDNLFDNKSEFDQVVSNMNNDILKDQHER